MDKAILKRLEKTEVGLRGAIFYGNQLLCQTLEENWNNNKKGMSCIPDGSYLCTKHDSPKHPQSWEVLNVKGRNAILIHTGNTLADTEGCILVGLSVTDVGIGSSRLAMNKLKETLPDTFILEVQNGT